MADQLGNTLLNWYSDLPDGFLHARATELHDMLGGPSLIALKGNVEETVFVSILLHGNEVTGLLVLQNLLRKLDKNQLPRNLLIFTGNTESAAQGLRHLDGQPDYNRIWDIGNSREHAMAQMVLDYVAQSHPVAAIDIHNNTGRNPLYGCINHVDRRFIHLARLFSDKIVFFSEPHEVIANNVARFCPSVTLECGLPGDPAGVARAAEVIEHCLTAPDIYRVPETGDHADVFHTVARMMVNEDCRISFNQNTEPADLRLPRNIDEHNFSMLTKGFLLGHYANGTPPLRVVNDAGIDVSDQYLDFRNGGIYVAKPFLPSMLTLDSDIIRQDCLGYVMETYDLDAD